MKTTIIAAVALAASIITTAQAVELQALTYQEQQQEAEREMSFQCGYEFATGAASAPQSAPQSGWPDSDKVIAWAVRQCRAGIPTRPNLDLPTEQVDAAARKGAELALIKYLPRTPQ